MLKNCKDVLSVKQVMEILAVGKNTVYDLIRSEQLDDFRIGRTYKIPKNCLKQYISAKTSGELY